MPSGAGLDAEEVTNAAGFDVSRTNDGQPFVCRIDSQPDQSREDCNDTPPSNAYWGLFWKRRQHRVDVLDPRSGRARDRRRLVDRLALPGRRDAEARRPPGPGATRRRALRRGRAPAARARPGSLPRRTSPPTRPLRPPRLRRAVPRPPRPLPHLAGVADLRERRDGGGPVGRPVEPAVAEGRAGLLGEPERAHQQRVADGRPHRRRTDAAGGSFATVTDGDDDGGGGVGGDTGLAAVAGLGGLSLLAGSAAVVAYRRGRS